MSAYVIVDVDIENAEEYDKYKALAKPLVEKHGGSYLARGGALEVIDDDLWSPTRVVILEFPDMETARKFFASEDYAPVAAVRRANSKSTVAIVDGT